MKPHTPAAHKTLMLPLAAGLLLSAHHVFAATTFTGAVDNTWEDAGNWSAGLPDAADDVSLDTAATLTSTATIRRLLLQGTTDILTIDAGGDLTGTASVGLINDGASLVVNSGGSYTRAGTLDIRDQDGFVGGGITINDGGVFDLTSLRAADGTLEINGSTADVTFVTLKTVDPNTNDGNNNTFTSNNANLTLNGATLNVTGNMQWDGASAISVGNGSTLNFAASTTQTHVLSDGLVTAAGGVVKFSGSGDQTLADDISGGGSFEQSGTGTTTLSGTNTYSGGTTVSNGRLHLDSLSAAGTGAITLSGGTLSTLAVSWGSEWIDNDIVVTDATTSSVYSPSGDNQYKGAVTGSGTLNFGNAASGLVRWATDMSGFTGTVNYDVIDGGNQFWLEPSSGGAAGQITAAKFNLTGATSGSSSMRVRGEWEIGELAGTGGYITGWNSTLTVNQSTDTTFEGVMANAGTRTLGLTKDGTGTLTLTGANTYSRGTTLDAGKLRVNNNEAIGTGTLTLNGGIFSNATGTDVTINEAIVVNGTAALITETSTTGQNLTLAGNITGAGTINLGGTGDGQGSRFVEFEAGVLNGFTGTLSFNNVTGGNRVLLRGQNAPDAKLVLSGSTSGQYMGFQNGIANSTFGELSGTGGRIIAWNRTLTIDQDTDTTFAGTLANVNASNRLGFTKAGSGTLTLTGNNSYTDATTVNAGTLSLASGSSHSGSGAYIVNGGILEIATGVDLSTHAMTIAGVISPGNSPGTAATGAQTWLDGGSYLWEINDSGGTQGADSGWDWLDITGTLDLTNLTTGGFTIDIDSLTLGNVAGDADGFDSYIQLDGIADYSFTIATASLGISGFDDSLFTLDYSGFSNAPGWDWGIVLSDNSLVLEAYAVPEPSSTALSGLGGLALMLRRKRS